MIGDGESGIGFRAVDPAWARGLRALCLRQGVPFFWNQWDGRTPKAGGRLLDSVEWSQYPAELEVSARCSFSDEPARSTVAA